MKKLTRPHKDATDNEKREFLRRFAATLDELGVVAGADFYVGTLVRGGIVTNPEAVFPAGARRSDPRTSRQAAADVTPRAGTQRALALRAVHSSGQRGMTYEEVEQATLVKGIWKRLSELKQTGWLRVVGQRRVSTGSEADVYVATDKGIRYCLGQPIDETPSSPPSAAPQEALAGFVAEHGPVSIPSAYQE